MGKLYGLVLCYLFTAAIAVGWANEVISIGRSGILSSPAANASLQVKLEKHADNRSIKVTCESESLYRSSEKDLEGERTPLVLHFDFQLDRGWYDCTALLFRQKDGDKKEFSTSTKFFIN